MDALAVVEDFDVFEDSGAGGGERCPLSWMSGRSGQHHTRRCSYSGVDDCEVVAKLSFTPSSRRLFHATDAVLCQGHLRHDGAPSPGE